MVCMMAKVNETTGGVESMTVCKLRNYLSKLFVNELKAVESLG